MNEAKRKRHSTNHRTRLDLSDSQQRNDNHNCANQSQRTKNIPTHNHESYNADCVRRIVQEEGRTARNLVQYSVPIECSDDCESDVVEERREERAHQHSSHSQSPCGPHKMSAVFLDADRRNQSASQLTRSPATERGQKKKPIDLRTRYWKFLFDNFQRAVDSIYQMCEQDESVVECREVIMVLEQGRNDFKSLIERLKVMKAFDDAARDGDRPSSIAWEVRKMSPGKHVSPSIRGVQLLQSPVDKASTIKLPNTSADKVKGVRAITFTGLPSHMTEDGCGSVVGSHDSSSHTTYHQTDTSQPVPNCSCSSVMVLQSHFASHISVPSDPITTSGNPSTTCHKSPLSFPEFPTSQSTDTSTAISHVFQPIDTSTEVSHISQPTDTPREICHTSQLIGKSTEISHSSQPTDRCREICHISQSALLSTSYLVMTCSSPTVPHHVKCSQTTVSPDMKPCTLVTSCVASCTEPLQTLSYGNSSVDVKDIQIHGSQDALWYSASGSVRRRTEALSLYTLTEACCHDNQAVQPGSTVSPERLPLCATGSLACDLALNSEDCADDDDGGGWETVQRSRSRVRHSPSLKTTDCVVDTVYTVSKKFSDSSFIRDTVCTVSNECSYSSSIMDTVCTVSNECSDSSFIVDTVCTVSNECSGSSFIRDTVCTVSKKCSDSSFIRDTVCTVSNECSGSSSIAFSDSARSGLPLSHIQIYYDDDCHSVSTDTSANPDCVGVSQQCQHSGVLCHQVDSRPCHGNPSITVHLEANVFTDDADANSDSEPKGQSSEEYLLPNMATVEGITYRGSSCMGPNVILLNGIKCSPNIVSMMEACQGLEVLEKEMNWLEMVDELEARTPGHGVHMHRKLSSPSRQRSQIKSHQWLEEKQAKAQELRQRLLQEKSERLRDLLKKVYEVRAVKEDLTHLAHLTVEQKLQRAEEKRLMHLKETVQKAHDEKAKVNEIAFINTLEAQNKRHDILSKHQESEARLQDMLDGRQRRHEEKQAKEAAVEERRRALNEERLTKLHDMQERRKLRDARIQQQQREKEKERQETIQAREKDREERLAALSAQHHAQKTELQKKIQQKQDDSTQRHEEYLRQIREKAFEMSVLRHSTEDHNDAPEPMLYEWNKLCTICDVLIPSEIYLLSHLLGKKHQQALLENSCGHIMSKKEIESFNLKHVVDAPAVSIHPKIVTEKERRKAMRKRCKKICQRMIAREAAFEASEAHQQQMMVNSQNKARIHKAVKEIDKCLQKQDSGAWAHSNVLAVTRVLGELYRVLNERMKGDQHNFRILGGLCRVSRLLTFIGKLPATNPALPDKQLKLACNVLCMACHGNFDTCRSFLFSDQIRLAVDRLLLRMTVPTSPGGGHPTTLPVSKDVCTIGVGKSGGPSYLPHDGVCVGLISLLTTVLSCLAKGVSAGSCDEQTTATIKAMSCRTNDVVSYTISVGVVDRLKWFFGRVRGPLDSDTGAQDFVDSSLRLMVAVTQLMLHSDDGIFERNRFDDPSQLIFTLSATDLVGIVTLLYSTLLHSGAPPRADGISPSLMSQRTVSVVMNGLRVLNHTALLHLPMLQSTLGAEGSSLQFRHIVSYLLWFIGRHPCEELLHEVIICVGYFTVLNADNQAVVQSGPTPTVLQQLCSLPFEYFSDQRLTAVLFPTLIACCYDNRSNRSLLEQELSCLLLANFIEEEILEKRPLRQPYCNGNQDSSVVDFDNKEMERFVSFRFRFPQDHWSAAQAYFQTELTSL